MPELPEVETVARDLRGLIVGATITGAGGDWPRAIASHATVDAFAAAVAGRRVEAVGRRAKLVVVELSGDPAPGRGPAALTIHLKMTGQLFVVPAATPADRHVHVVLALEDGRELRFRDIRKFGRVGCWPIDPATGAVLDGATDEELFAGFGPEPLDDAFTLRAFRGRLRGRRSRLKPLLLDQGFIAGVGNIYADEALFRARLHPLRSRGDACGHRTRHASTASCGRSWRRRSSGAARRSTTTRPPRAMASCRSASTSTSARASRARAAGGRSAGSSSARGPRTSARGASASRPPTGRARPRS